MHTLFISKSPVVSHESFIYTKNTHFYQNHPLILPKASLFTNNFLKVPVELGIIWSFSWTKTNVKYTAG